MMLRIRWAERVFCAGGAESVLSEVWPRQEAAAGQPPHREAQPQVRSRWENFTAGCLFIIYRGLFYSNPKTTAGPLSSLPKVFPPSRGAPICCSSRTFSYINWLFHLSHHKVLKLTYVPPKNSWPFLTQMLMVLNRTATVGSFKKNEWF